MKTKSTFFVFITVFIFLLSIQTNAQVVLYGLTSGGGSSNAGTVFSVTPTGNIDTIVSLNSTYAAVAGGSLLYASDGNFYASSIDGGYGDSCTIFRCTPTGVLHTMINLDSVWGSSAPMGNSLNQAFDGNLYGMTTMGGTYGEGVLFRLKLSGRYDSIHVFSGMDGSYPYGSLIQTQDSMLWGMTTKGGSNNFGSIFHCTTSGAFTSVFSFDSTNGYYPNGDLLLANDGNFYGLTSKGGKHNKGTLFRYNPTGAFTKLIDFDSVNGAHPSGSLIQATDNNLYGLTSDGGIIESNSGYGTLFVCTLSGNLTTLVNFKDTTNGAHPMGTLIQASDGYLYGMTEVGGKYGFGTIFQSSLAGYFTKLVDFNDTNGAAPMYGKLIEVDNISTGINTALKKSNSTIFPNPNNGQFTIGMKNEKLIMKNIEIYNVLGQNVYSSSLPQTPKGASSEINLSTQSNGVYLYRVLDENGNVISNGKFVIEK